MNYLADKQLNTICGRASVGKTTKKDVKLLLKHIDALHAELDIRDGEDYFGTEGWKHAFGHPDME